MSEFGPFRPLKPLVEADGVVFLPSGPPRLQRLRDRAALVQAVTSMPATVLVGPSGSGKTSMVQAGLVPALRSRGWEVFGPDEAAPASQGVLVVDDALAHDADVEGLLPSLTAAAAAGAAILLVIEEQDLWRLQALETKTGRLPGRVDLRPLPEVEVAQLVEEAVLAGGAYFEAGLASLLAEELTADGPVTPAVIQLAAASMVAERVATVRAFRAVGGVEGLRDRFLQKAAKSAAPSDGRAARRILAELAAAPLSTVARLAEVAELGPAAATAVLQALEQQGLIARRSDGGVALAAEWLRPLLVTFTAAERRAAVGARASLRRATSRPMPILMPGELAAVRAHAGQLDEGDAQIVRRSRWLWRAVIGAAVAVPLVVAGSSWLSEGRRAHLGASSEGLGAPLWLRLGSPAGWARHLPHRPAFGAPLTDTGWVRGSLRAGLPSQAWLHADWVGAVRAELRPIPSAAAAWLVDQNLQPLSALFDDATARPSVLTLLELAGSGEPNEVALVRRALTLPAATSGSSEDLRRQALTVATSWLRRGRPAGAELVAEAVRGKVAGSRAAALQGLHAALASDDAALRAGIVPLLTIAATSDDAATRRAGIEQLVAEADRGTAGARASLVAALAGAGQREVSVALGPRAENPAGLIDGEESGAALAALAVDAKASEETRLEALALLGRRTGDPPALATLSALPGSARWQAAVLPWILRGKPVEDVWPRVVQAAHAAPPMRAAAATLLASGSIPRSPDSTKLIKTLSQDSNGEVRAAAAHAVATLGGEGQTLLVRALKSGGADAERAVVEVAASEAAKRPALAPLLELAARSPRLATRRAAIVALGKLATEKPSAAIPALGRLGHDKNAELRAASVQALAVALGNDRAARDATQLLRVLNRDPDASVRRQAVAALVAAKGVNRTATVPAAKAAASFAGDADAGVRVEVAATLAILGAADATWASLLRDRDAGVRAAARRATITPGLGLKSSPELDAAVAEGLAAATVAERPEWAALAGALGAPGALSLALNSSSVEVRRAAAASIRPSTTTTATQAALEAATADEDLEVRRDALAALAGVHAVPALAAAISSADPRTRVAVLRAMAGHAPEAADPAWTALVERGLADGSETVRVAAAVAVGTLGRPGLPLVGAPLRDAARDVREAAAVSAARLWKGLPPAQLTELAAATENGMPTPFERRAAAVWVTPPGPVTSVPNVYTYRDPDAPLLDAIRRGLGGRPEELGRLLSLLR